MTSITGRFAFCATVFSLVVGLVQTADAAKLGVANQLGLPTITYNSTGTLVYHQSDQLLTVNATPLQLRLSGFASGNRFGNIANGDVAIQLQIVEVAGGMASVAPGSLGSDLTVTGTVTVTNNNDGATNPVSFLSGTLLTGTIVAFGFEDSGTIDSYDMLFEPTGGELLSYFQDGQIGVLITSEFSTFTGTLSGSVFTDFGGGAKGTIGYVACPRQSVTGTVSCTTTNEMLDGVPVELRDSGGNLIATDTTGSGSNASGTYTFTNLGKGDYTVSIAAPDGYEACTADDTSRPVKVTCQAGGQADFCACEKQTPCEQKIVVAAACTKDGAVINVAGVKCDVKDAAEQVVASGETDASGSFTTGLLAPGDYTVVVTSVPEGFEACDTAPVAVKLECNADGAATLCVCPCVGTIRGNTVCEGAELATAGVTVKISGPGGEQEFVIGADGKYEFTGLKPGDYQFSILSVPAGSKLCEDSTQPVTLTLNCNDTLEHDVCVCPCVAKVSGKVECKRGCYTAVPVEGATVMLTGPLASYSVATDAEGHYAIENLPEGSYTMSVAKDGYKLCKDDQPGFELGCGEARTYDVCLCPCEKSSIKGKIVCRNGSTVTPVPGITVTVTDGTVTKTAKTSKYGTYVVFGLKPGTYTVAVLNPPAGSTVCEGSLTQQVVLECEQDARVEFCLCPKACQGSITGTIVCAKNDAPIEGATVKLYKGYTLLGTDTTDAEGAYSFGPLDLGTYTVKVVALPANTDLCYGTSNCRSVSLSSCGEAKTADFCACTRVCENASIQGAVICSKNNSPVPGVEITISRRGYSRTVTTAADGTYSVSDLLPGIYTVKITKLPLNTDVCCRTESERCVKLCCGETERVSFCACTKTCDPGTISGKVTCSKNGAAVSGVEITISKNGYSKTVTTGSDGTYSVQGLAAGSYSVKVTKLPQGAELCCGTSSCRSVNLSCGEKETADFCVCVKTCDPAMISGKVTCSKTGVAVSGVEITISKNGFSRTVTTGGDGTYSVQGLAVGSYSVKVTKLPSGAELCCGTSSCKSATLSCGENETADFCVCQKQSGSQGCTPGYWKNHTGSWKGYTCYQKLNTVFGTTRFPHRTLLDALKQGGGGIDALGRAATAALLNASHHGVAYGLTIEQVITLTRQALASGGDIEGTKNYFDALNNSGCPLN